ncbi:biopolymer transport protein ExbD [Ereboglobus sp. PH5-5]|uniref:hypothetical protein n=1 Tax=Ereboglobus sp. PH5-5 TaxID=2940529 RepID=UPI00240738C3|nr:hypothetical protein [Ereboglobus sp. PH5-5]MDF9834180.1 biopolymer transport protein ExbD [Ereboglobus sp. PH5-5]
MSMRKPFVVLVVMFSAILILAACSKKTPPPIEQKEAEVDWVPPPLSIESIFYDREPLVVQVSQATVVYVSHIPVRPGDVDRYTYNPDDEIIVMPSDLDDIPARMDMHKATQDVLKKPASILLTGDDFATCGPVVAVIDSATRAGIEQIFFETNYRERGRVGFKVEVGGGVSLKYSDHTEKLRNNPELSKNILNITVSDNDTILWEKTPVTPEEYADKLRDYAIRVGPENAIAIVNVNSKTGYPAFRFVLDQMKRCVIQSVQVRLHRHS